MVGKALGVKVELQQVTGANRIPFLLTDKVDIVISVMGLTPERAKQIMFTAPYANTSLAVYGPKNLAIKSPADLGRYKVAAAKGIMLDAEIEAYQPDQQTLEARELRRQDFLARLFYVARKEAAELATHDTAERYTKALDDIAVN